MKRIMVVTILAVTLCLTVLAQEKKPDTVTKQSEAKGQQMDKKSMSDPQTGQHSKTEEEIMKLEDQWVQTRATKDPASTRSLLADDFLGSNPNGESQTKQQFIDSVVAGNFAGGQSSYSERKVRIYGDTAISTGLVTGAGQSGADKIRYMRVYVKHNNQWQLVAVQATRVTANQ